MQIGKWAGEAPASTSSSDRPRRQRMKGAPEAGGAGSGCRRTEAMRAAPAMRATQRAREEAGGEELGLCISCKRSVMQRQPAAKKDDAVLLRARPWRDEPRSGESICSDTTVRGGRAVVDQRGWRRDCQRGRRTGTPTAMRSELLRSRLAAVGRREGLARRPASCAQPGGRRRAPQAPAGCAI